MLISGHRTVGGHMESTDRSDRPLAAPREPAATGWRFLTNHGHVLIFLSRHPEARIRDIAVAVGITERSTQAILAELESDGYVTKIKVGRRNRYQLHPDQGFRHPQESTQPIGALLRIFS